MERWETNALVCDHLSNKTFKRLPTAFKPAKKLEKLEIHCSQSEIKMICGRFIEIGGVIKISILTISVDLLRNMIV